MTNSPIVVSSMTSMLSQQDKIDFHQDWARLQSLVPVSSVMEEGESDYILSKGTIQHYINAKNLACPMPLLKLKMALKNTQVGNGVYVTATDPNSTQDIGAFCRHLGYTFSSFTSENGEKVFHLLVQKTV